VSCSAAPAGAPIRSQARSRPKQEFAGYWEYLLDEAIFTCPAHPNWGGAGLISGDGETDRDRFAAARARGAVAKAEHVNMIVPIDLLKPVIDDLRRFGKGQSPLLARGSACIRPRSTIAW